MTNTKRSIEQIDFEYLKKYPKAESLLSGFETYGEKRLIEIFDESKGREIVFKNGKGLDNMTYYFKD